MKKISCLLLPAVLLCSICDAQRMNIKPSTYPKTAKGSVTDTYFNTVVPDPYRWLEDDRSTETKAWVAEQNKVTQSYLQQIPYRDAIRKRLETLWNYEKYSAPFKEGNYTYYYKNNGLQSQSVLYRQTESGQPEVFLDPNQFSKDGTTSLAGISFTQDGSLAAYRLSTGGSDWTNVVIMNAETKATIGDTLHDIKFSGIAWKSNDGFYYSSYDKPKDASQLSGMTQYHKLYYHKLGTKQSEDKLVFGGEQTPRRYIGAYLTEDERYLVITAANSTTGNELYIQDLSQPNSQIVNVVNNMDNVHSVVDNAGSKLYIYTNLYAPTYRLVTVDAANPEPTAWKDLIAKSANVLEVSTAGGKLFAHYLKDATTLIQQYNMDGKLEHAVALPSVGTASGFSAKKDERDIYYSFTSYTYPSTIFKYNVASGKSEIYKKSGVQFNPDLYESKQVFYKSKDGTKVPMIITYKKGTVLNGHNPTLLYAYGGFGVSLTPSFSTSNIVLLEQGGIYAVPNLRGGGEYGETWHKAGTKMRKQNVFDDFIAAAEYLIKSKYTSKEFLAVAGGSNGGLLVGATITQRPDLCQVAFPAVGVMDMLRYNKFTAGAGWAYDYGTAEESEGMFEYLYHYSPYHALKPASYPATMVTTADHDDRVVPAHSFKFAARLQEYQQGTTPTLIRIETNAGHGAGRSTAQIIGQETDKWAFMFANMGVEYR
jgi:prolyl oligopeptidase